MGVTATTGMGRYVVSNYARLRCMIHVIWLLKNQKRYLRLWLFHRHHHQQSRPGTCKMMHQALTCPKCSYPMEGATSHPVPKPNGLCYQVLHV
jgi:hypothetical protein